MAISISLSRFYATKTGAIVPKKQALMKKQKAIAQSIVESVGGNNTKLGAAAITDKGANKAALTSALFPNIVPKSTDRTLQRKTEEYNEFPPIEQKTTIAKGWSRFKTEHLHFQTYSESQNAKGKLLAIEALKNICPELARRSTTYDYTLPPINRRVLTDTSTIKLPFSVEFAADSERKRLYDSHVNL